MNLMSLGYSCLWKLLLASEFHVCPVLAIHVDSSLYKVGQQLGSKSWLPQFSTLVVHFIVYFCVLTCNNSKKMYLHSFFFAEVKRNKISTSRVVQFPPFCDALDYACVQPLAFLLYVCAWQKGIRGQWKAWHNDSTNLLGSQMSGHGYQ